jgi:tyrosyl-tRNA synthetase
MSFRQTAKMRPCGHNHTRPQARAHTLPTRAKVDYHQRTFCPDEDNKTFMLTIDETKLDEQVDVLMSGAEYGDPQIKANMRRELRERLIECQKQGRPLRVYCGYDPRKPDLHLGHTITMRKLRQFQDYGHDVTFLIGIFTSMIGDPSDKTEARDQLTYEQVQENARTYAEQAFKILDRDKTRVRYNNEWLESLNFADIIRLASSFTVQQFLSRENFANRIEGGQPIFLHEFFYSLMQAYDAVAQECDVQVGGQDQLFNILTAGRGLQKAMGQLPMIAIIMGESLPGTDGALKMSKSSGNAIPLLSEPWDMYGKVMSVPDQALSVYHRLLLGWTDARAQALVDGIADGTLHPNEEKMRLARELVSIFHSPADAEAAQKRWDDVFRNKGGSHIPDDIPQEVLTAEERIVNILKRLNMTPSANEARRLIEQKGVRLNEVVVADVNASVTLDMLPCVLQVGKRKFVRLVGA